VPSRSLVSRRARNASSPASESRSGRSSAGSDCSHALRSGLGRSSAWSSSASRRGHSAARAASGEGGGDRGHAADGAIGSEAGCRRPEHAGCRRARPALKSIQMFTSRPGLTGHDTPFGGFALVRRAVVSVLRAAGRVQAPWPQRRAGAPWVGGHNEARR
jgi:hypothetical protein